MSQLPEFEDKNPYHRASSLSDLLSFHDLDFIRCAYVTIFGRQPDLPGQAHHVQELRAGTSKLDILLRLRQAPEGQHHDPGIAGLDRALKRAAWQRRPLLGTFSRLVRGDADGNARSERDLRALLNVSWVNQATLRAIGEQLSAIPAATGPVHLATAVGHADPLQRSGHGSAGERVDASPTPELDHLRIKKVTERYRGHVAP